MRILIVDDEKNIRESLKMILQQEGYEITTAENGLSAQRVLEDATFDLGIFDLKMPGMDGLDLLKWLKGGERDFPVYMISAFGQVEDAVNALKSGADDYITKPFNPDLLLEKVRIIDSVKIMESRMEKGRHSRQDGFFLGQSPGAEKLYRRMERIAATRSNILLTGESGVGKEVTARLIHNWSDCSEEPFVALNIGGVPETLLESELFGYEKGAFTGADKRKPGIFETARGGSLFLDEIGEMPLPLQVKILRVLQDRSFRRLGGLVDLKIESRIITATNRNLEEMVISGGFREDLYYRLNVARLEIPPLRERMDELPQLTGFLLEKLNGRMGMSVKGLAPGAWKKLESYRFPGNVRELENILERAMIFAEEDILSPADIDTRSAADLTNSATRSGGTVPGRTLKDMERDSIAASLHRWEGNRSRAAKELGISRRTIINKIQEYRLEDTTQGGKP